MGRFITTWVRVLGIGRPMPALAFVALVVALVALLQLPVSLVIHRTSLGLGIALNELIVMAALPLAVAWWMRFDRRRLFPLETPDLRAWLPLALLTIGAVVVIDFLTAGSEAILPLPEKYQRAMDEIMLATSAPQFAYKFFLLCILPGVCEEIFFRGFCQTSIAARKGNAVAIVITGAVFALLHGNPWHIHLYFILGCFLSWIYAVSGTLWVPIACHVFNNAWTFTNHTFDTTPPLEGVSTMINALILIAGVALAILGGILFLMTYKRAREII